MVTSHGDKREHPSTYFVQDRSNQDELTRLQIQDQLVTTCMGGVLPEQADTARLQSVLDVGCGTGGWLIELAKTSPQIKRLVGVDISSKMLDYARAQAIAQGVGDRVEFMAMDALRMLEFSDHSFDLVNHRFGISWVRKWEWKKLLSEYRRVCKVGGIVRVTEAGAIPVSTSLVLTTLCELLVRAFFQAGHYFTETSDGITSQLAPMITQQSFDDVQTQCHTLEYRAGTPTGQQFYEDIKLVLHTVQPFLRKWTRVPDEYEATYQQALEEMRQLDFVATTQLLTVWGVNLGRYSKKQFSGGR